MSSHFSGGGSSGEVVAPVVLVYPDSRWSTRAEKGESQVSMLALGRNGTVRTCRCYWLAIRLDGIRRDAGYYDPAAFRRIFKQTTGSSPSEYRRAVGPRQAADGAPLGGSIGGDYP